MLPLLLHLFSLIAAISAKEDTFDLCNSSALSKYFSLALNKSATLHWSLCDEHQQCDDALACLVDDGRTVNLARNLGEIKPISSGGLSVLLDDGEDCDGKRKKSLRVELFCDQTATGIGGNVHYLQDQGCEQVLIWDNKDVCDLFKDGNEKDEEYVGSSCRVHMPHGLVDLKSALEAKPQQGFYLVRGQDSVGMERNFQLNLCNSVSSSSTCPENSLLCEVATDDHRLAGITVPFSVNPTVFYDEINSNVVMHYVTEGSTIVFTIVCDRERNEPSIEIESIMDMGQAEIVRFEMRSNAVCATKRMQCQLRHQDKLFDLAPLMSAENEWMAYDNRRGEEQNLYHISVCQALPIPLLMECGGSLESSLASCQKPKDSNQKGISLGSFNDESLSFRESDQSLVINYDNGSECNGQGTKFSTEISFKCYNKETGPRLIDVNDNCRYVFEWHSPYACPVLESDYNDDKEKKDKYNECVVRDNEFGHSFDINALYDPIKDYVVYKEGEGEGAKDVNKVAFNVCQGWNGEQHLSFVDNLLRLHLMTSKSCGSGVFEHEILFKCHHNKKDSKPIFVSEEECKDVFIWQTHFACPPFTETQCLVQGLEDNNVIDLSSLSLANDNYMVSGSRSTFSLNICRSLVLSNDTRCPYASSVCMVTTDDKEEVVYTNLGEASGPPTLDVATHDIVIDYNMGEMCKDEHSDEKHMSTRIFFKCNKDEERLRFIERIGCKFYFMYETHLVCAHRQNSDGANNDCAVIDPYTSHRYDLSSLKGVAFEAPQKEESGKWSKYIVSICSPIKGQESELCGSQSSSCHINSDNNIATNLGQTSSKLSLEGDTLTLAMEEGSKCSSDQSKKRKSVVKIVCLPDDTQYQQLVFVEELQCTSYFELYTTLACQKTVSCTTSHNNDIFDLTVLMSYDSDYSSYYNSDWPKTFLFSVCKPLVNPEVKQCPTDSAICKIHEENGENKAISLGEPSTPLMYEKGDLVLHYTKGSLCRDDHEKNEDRDDYSNGITWSSEIRFQCHEEALHGKPYLLSLDYGACLAKFRWPTSYACPNSTQVQSSPKSSQCMVYHSHLEGFVNLTALRRENEDYKIELEDKVLLLQPCGKSEHCQGSLCVDSEDFGHLKGSFYDERDQILHVLYEGDRCKLGTEKRRSEIRFICDTSIGRGEPKLFATFPCHFILEWRTKAVCHAVHPSRGDLTMKPSGGFSTLSIIGALFLVSLLFAALLWLRSPDHRLSLRRQMQRFALLPKGEEEVLINDLHVRNDNSNDDDDFLIVA